MRLGLAGCGRLAEVGYLPAFERAAGVRLVAVADPERGRRERLAGLASRAGQAVEPHPDAGAMIAAGTIEALVIATPPDAHLGVAARAAEASLPTLVEKPPGTDAIAADLLTTLEPRPWIGFNRRFQQGVALRRAVPPEGPLDLELELHYRRASWAAHVVRLDALGDLGPHLVDLALFVARAAPRAVRCPRAEPEAADVELATDRGVARIRCRTDRIHAERVEIRAASGDRYAGHRVGGHAAAVLGRLRRRHPLVDSLARQLEAFGRGARGLGAETLADAADGARVMAVIDAARASARRGGTRTEVARATHHALPSVQPVA